MKKLMVLAAVLCLLLSSGCLKPTPADELFDTPEAAYNQKYLELVDAYGPAEIKTGFDSKGMGYRWLDGVCCVELFDFDGDGADELFLIYKDVDTSGIPQAGTYRLEVWTYTDGKLTLLLLESRLDTCSASKWYPGDIFVTVCVDSSFRPVIQFYDETDSGCTYTNLYYADGAPVRDELVQAGESFSLNGSDISYQDFFNGVRGETKVLFGIALSCSDYTGAYLQLLSRNELIPALARVASVSASLAGGEPAEKPEFLPLGAFKGFFTLCVDEINPSVMPEEPEWIRRGDYLFDLNRDGIPEIITASGNTEVSLFTFRGGEMVYSGMLAWNSSGLYTAGTGDIISFWAHMGYYEVTKATHDGIELVQEIVAKDYIEGGDYPDLEDFGFYGYSYLFDFIQENEQAAALNRQWLAAEFYLENLNAVLG